MFAPSIQQEAAKLAGLIAALWGVHPLQTESVTYVIQRAESLMGFFYLLTLYAFARSLDSPRGGIWRTVSVFSCFLGMGTKEVMVSAPLMVLLYDRIFILGSFTEIWKKKGGYYAALATTWVLLGGALFFAEGRGTTAGFNAGLSIGDYFQTQCWALIHYLKLFFWPYPLVLDYGTGTVTALERVLPCLSALLVLGVVLLLAMKRWKGILFLGLGLMVVLLPSSSIIPITTQTIAEHRVYLALAPLMTILVLGLWRLLGRSLYWGGVVAISCCVILTYQRNATYKTVESIWRSTAEHAAYNPRAHNNYGGELLANGKMEEAEIEFKETLRLDPKYIGAYNNLGYLYQHKGLWIQAEQMYREALRLDERCSDAALNWAILLEQAGKIPEAMALYRHNLRFFPNHFKSNLNLGNLSLNRGDVAEAERLYRHCLTINPEDPTGYSNLAHIVSEQGNAQGALELYKKAIELDPAFFDARYNLALFLQKQKDLQGALEQIQVAVQLRPQSLEAHFLQANILFMQGKEEAAQTIYQNIVDQEPKWIFPYLNLAILFEHRGETRKAIDLYQRALQIEPKNVMIQNKIQALNLKQ